MRGPRECVSGIKKGGFPQLALRALKQGQGVLVGRANCCPRSPRREPRECVSGNKKRGFPQFALRALRQGQGVLVGRATLLSSKPEARAEGMRFGEQKGWIPSACASGFAAMAFTTPPRARNSKTWHRGFLRVRSLHSDNRSSPGEDRRTSAFEIPTSSSSCQSCLRGELSLPGRETPFRNSNVLPRAD